MGFIIGLLTLLMVLDCVVLVLLVLLQLPKKEAGAGLAFGGAATDALFGAGSGNVLTKITKYVASIFFVLAFLLSILQSRYYHGSSDFLERLTRPGQPAPMALPPTAPATQPAAAPAATNALKSAPQAEATNMPARRVTPPAPATPVAPTNTTAPK